VACQVLRQRAAKRGFASLHGGDVSQVGQAFEPDVSLKRLTYPRVLAV